MSVSRNVATVLLEPVFDNYSLELGDDTQQPGIGPGPEKRDEDRKDEWSQATRLTQSFRTFRVAAGQ